MSVSFQNSTTNSSSESAPSPKARKWLSVSMAALAVMAAICFVSVHQVSPALAAPAPVAETDDENTPLQEVDDQATNDGDGEAKSADSIESNEKPASRETFKRVVIAGLPPVIGGMMEALPSRIEEVTGVRLAPEWWRLDMACFSSTTPFNGKQFAVKAGLVVISDVADELIVAPMDTPEVRQAEARLFMLGLFEDKTSPGMWSAVSPFKAETQRFQGPNVMLDARGRPMAQDPTKPTEEEILFDARELFLLSGTLDNPKVQAAIGANPSAFARPMVHYKLSDFKLSDYTPTHQGGGSSSSRVYSSYDYNSGKRTYEHSKTLVITAMEGIQQPDIPTGPSLDGFIDPMAVASMISGRLMAQVMRGLGRSTSYYSSSSSVSRTSNPPAESAQFACMLLEDFRKAETLSIEAKAKEVERIKALKAGGSSDEDAKAQAHKFLLENERGYRPARVTWADKTALAMMRDTPDPNGPANAAKTVLATRAVEVLTKHFKDKGMGAEFSFGRLGDWNLRQHYNFNWGYFDVSPYNGYSLEFLKAEDPAHAGQVILATAKGQPKHLEFSVRIDPATGVMRWQSGEPESKEVMMARRNEIREGAEILAKAAMEVSATTELDLRWVQAQLARQPEKIWTHISALDYEVDRILPGVIRVRGQAISVAEAQAAIVDSVSKRIIWETAAPRPDDAPSSDDMYYDYDW